MKISSSKLWPAFALILIWQIPIVTFAQDQVKQYVPNAKQGDEKLFKVVGTNDQGSSGVEAALDVEYIMGVAPGVLTEFWGYQQQDFCGDLQKFSQKILDTEDAPNVFSISYGWQGKLSQLGCQDSEVQAVDVNFQKLAARGVSMIIASGDTGAAWTPGHPEPKDCAKAEPGVSFDGTGNSLNSGGIESGDFFSTKNSSELFFF